MLACDILTGVGYEALAKMQKGVTKALVNTRARDAGAVHARSRPRVSRAARWSRRSRTRSRPGDAEFLDATKLATGLMGDSIATNLFMVGYAYQRGLLPVGEAAILRAIELNGAAVESNKQSFRWGRLAAVDPAHVSRRGDPRRPSPTRSGCRNRSTRSIARRVEVPDRLPGRRVRQALHRPRREGRAKREAREDAGHRRRSPKPSRATTSSCSRSRTSTKSRGCTPRPTSPSASPRSSKATTSSRSTSRRRSSTSPTR